jgi:hypothetical protein
MRKTKQQELSEILSPLLKDALTFLESIGVSLDIDQTIQFLSHVREKANELAAANGNGGT